MECKGMHHVVTALYLGGRGVGGAWRRLSMPGALLQATPLTLRPNPPRPLALLSSVCGSAETVGEGSCTSSSQWIAWRRTATSPRRQLPDVHPPPRQQKRPPEDWKPLRVLFRLSIIPPLV